MVQRRAGRKAALCTHCGVIRAELTGKLESILLWRCRLLKLCIIHPLVAVFCRCLSPPTLLPRETSPSSAAEAPRMGVQLLLPMVLERLASNSPEERLLLPAIAAGFRLERHVACEQIAAAGGGSGAAAQGHGSSHEYRRCRCAGATSSGSRRGQGRQRRWLQGGGRGLLMLQ